VSLVTNVIVLPGSQVSDRPVGSTRDQHEAETELERRLQESYEGDDEDESSRHQCLREITRGYTLSHPAEEREKVRCLWGGSKYPECDVFAAAFNFLRWDEFKAWIEDLPWIARDQVRVLVMGEDHRAFEVWTFGRGGQLERVLDGQPW